MSRQVTYNGSTAQRIGRFGLVQPGQVLSLRETEFLRVRGLADFTESKDERDEEAAAPVPLQDTPFFRFTSLPWGTPRIHRALRRLGRRQLSNVSTAFNHIGVPCNVSPDMSREDMAEVAIEAGRKAGWVD